MLTLFAVLASCLIGITTASRTIYFQIEYIVGTAVTLLLQGGSHDKNGEESS